MSPTAPTACPSKRRTFRRSRSLPDTSVPCSCSRSRVRRDAGMPVQLSIGIATFPRPLGDANALVEAADTAMYRAKSAGGGVRVWEHSFAEGPRGSLRNHRMPVAPAPYLADPARLASPELQRLVPDS